MPIINQIMTIMRNDMAKQSFKLVPGYYEWHLKDKSGRTILNLIDPSEELDECNSYQDVLNMCEGWYYEAYNHYEAGEEYNGLKIDPSTIPCGNLSNSNPVRVMARTLWNYYFAA